MGVITPEGEMLLISVDIDATQTHQLYFTSQLAQEAFFKSKAVASVAPDVYTFIQKDELVRVNRNADALYNANYLMYRNAAHSNRWFYAFIKEIKWMSDSSSAITFETDVYQTWRWDVAFRQSLIERETTPTDLAGDHLLDEGLEFGEYVTGTQVAAGLGEMVICVATTIESATASAYVEAPWSYTKVTAQGTVITNVYSGSMVIWFPNTAAGRADLNTWLMNITAAGANDAITAIYMCPLAAVASAGNFNSGYKLAESFTGLVKTVSLPGQSSTIDGYTPRNKKLYAYPYCLVYAHNSNGSGAGYQIEEFIGVPSFKVYGNVNALPQFKLVPSNYKGLGSNIDEALVLQNFPMCSYNIDSFKAWMAQNGTSAGIGVAGSVLGAAASVAMLSNPATAAVGAAGALGSVIGATQSLAKLGEATLQPPQAQGSANSGSVNATFNANDFYITYKTIRAEWAKVLDDYFTMYGYRVNKLDYPHFGCRQKWYYVKMINPNITGAIPAPDMIKLKQIFANGVTLWNNHSDIGNYNQSNLPV